MWFEHNQDSIRADLYQGLQDAFHKGECDTGNVNFTLEIYVTSLMANFASIFINGPTLSSYI